LEAEIESWEGLPYPDVFSKGVVFDVEVLGSPRVPEEVPRHPSSWDEATDLGELPRSVRRLRSGGEAGVVARLGDYAGALLIDRPDGTQWVLKLWPDDTSEQEVFRAQAMADQEGIYGAAATGYGPTPYGLVRATANGRAYAGVAMALVPGGSLEAKAAAVTFDTARQLDQYLQRLLDAGYYLPSDLQNLIDEEGNFQPVDFGFVAKLPAAPAERAAAIAGHGMASSIARRVRHELLAAAVENAQRESGRARVLTAPVRGTGMAVDVVERAVGEVRGRMRLPRGIGVTFVVGVDNDALVREYGIEPAIGRRPGYFRMEGGRGVVYLSAADHGSVEDVSRTVWHEVVGHYGWRLFSPETRRAVLAEVEELRVLDPELSARIKETYADEPADVQTEEFFAAIIENGVPSRLKQAWNRFLITHLGEAFVKIGALSNEQLDDIRRTRDLEPLYKLARPLLQAIRQNRSVYDASPVTRSRQNANPLGDDMPPLDESRLRAAGITRIDAISPASSDDVRRYVVTMGNRGSFVLNALRDRFFPPGTAELNDAFGAFRDIEIKFADASGTSITDHLVRVAEQFANNGEAVTATSRQAADVLRSPWPSSTLVERMRRLGGDLYLVLLRNGLVVETIVTAGQVAQTEYSTDLGRGRIVLPAEASATDIADLLQNAVEHLAHQASDAVLRTGQPDLESFIRTGEPALRLRRAVVAENNGFQLRYRGGQLDVTVETAELPPGRSYQIIMSETLDTATVRLSPELDAEQQSRALDAAYTALKTVELGVYDPDVLRARAIEQALQAAAGITQVRVTGATIQVYFDADDAELGPGLFVSIAEGVSDQMLAELAGELAAESRRRWPDYDERLARHREEKELRRTVAALRFVTRDGAFPPDLFERITPADWKRLGIDFGFDVPIDVQRLGLWHWRRLNEWFTVDLLGLRPSADAHEEDSVLSEIAGNRANSMSWGLGLQRLIGPNASASLVLATMGRAWDGLMTPEVQAAILSALTAPPARRTSLEPVGLDGLLAELTSGLVRRALVCAQLADGSWRVFVAEHGRAVDAGLVDARAVFRLDLGERPEQESLPLDRDRGRYEWTPADIEDARIELTPLAGEEQPEDLAWPSQIDGVQRIAALDGGLRLITFDDGSTLGVHVTVGSTAGGAPFVIRHTGKTTEITVSPAAADQVRDRLKSALSLIGTAISDRSAAVQEPEAPTPTPAPRSATPLEQLLQRAAAVAEARLDTDTGTLRVTISQDDRRASLYIAMPDVLTSSESRDQALAALAGELAAESRRRMGLPVPEVELARKVATLRFAQLRRNSSYPLDLFDRISPAEWALVGINFGRDVAIDVRRLGPWHWRRLNRWFGAPLPDDRSASLVGSLMLDAIASAPGEQLSWSRGLEALMFRDAASDWAVDGEQWDGLTEPRVRAAILGALANPGAKLKPVSGEGLLTELAAGSVHRALVCVQYPDGHLRVLVAEQGDAVTAELSDARRILRLDLGRRSDQEYLPGARAAEPTEQVPPEGVTLPERLDGVRRIVPVEDGTHLITFDSGFTVQVKVTAGPTPGGVPFVLRRLNALEMAEIVVADPVADQVQPALATIAAELSRDPKDIAVAQELARWAHSETVQGTPIAQALRELGATGITRDGELVRFEVGDRGTQEVMVGVGRITYTDVSDDRLYQINYPADGGTPVLTLSYELAWEPGAKCEAELGRALGELINAPTEAADVAQFVEYVRQWWWTRNRALTEDEVAAISAQLLAGQRGASGELGPEQLAALVGQAEDMLAGAQEQMSALRDDIAVAETRLAREIAADPAASPKGAGLESTLDAAYIQARLIAWLKRRLTALRITGLNRGPERPLSAPEWQQQIVEELVPRDQAGEPLRFTNADVWGPATNAALPKRERNCAETARAHLKSRNGDPTAAAMPAGTDGESFGAAELENEFGGRFQQLVEAGGDAVTGAELDTGLEQLEQALRDAGHGATAVLVFRPASERVGHVIVAEYNDAEDTPVHNRGVSYFDWEQDGRLRDVGDDGRPRLARPDLAGRVRAISAFVVDGAGDAVPIRDAAGNVFGRGLGNTFPPTSAYALEPTAYLSWLQDLASNLSRPDVDDVPLAGHPQPGPDNPSTGTPDAGSLAPGSPATQAPDAFDASLAEAAASSGSSLQPLVEVQNESAAEPAGRTVEGARAERELVAAERRLDVAMAAWNAARELGSEPGAEIEEALDRAADDVVRRRAEAGRRRAGDSVVDAVHRVESVVANAAAVVSAEQQVSAAQGRIDAARLVTPPMRWRLGRALGALRDAHTTERRAFLVLTRHDGTTYRVSVRNDAGRLRYQDSDQHDVARSTILREAAAGVVKVEALVLDAEGTALPPTDSLLANTSDPGLELVDGVGSPEGLGELGVEQQVAALGRIAQGMPMRAPADGSLVRFWAGAPGLPDVIAGVVRVVPVGPGWLRVTTRGGLTFTVGVRRGVVAHGDVAVQRVGDRARFGFVITVAEGIDRELADLTFGSRVDRELDTDWVEAAAAGHIAAVAAQLEVLEQVRVSLDTAASEVVLPAEATPLVDWMAVREALDDVRAALDDPYQPAKLALAAERVQAAHALSSTTTPLGELVVVVERAAEVLGGTAALRRGYDVPDRLAPVDVLAATKLLVRERRLNAGPADDLSRYDGWRLNRRRRARLREAVSAAGLDIGAVNHFSRFQLLERSGYGKVVELAFEHGTRPGLVATLPVTVDDGWLAATLQRPSFQQAVQATIEATNTPGVVTISPAGYPPFTLAVRLDGADGPAWQPVADVVLPFEADREAGPSVHELAGRVAKAIAGYRLAVDEVQHGTADSWQQARAAQLERHQSPDLLNWQALGGQAGTELSLDDLAAISWLRSFSLQYQDPTWREARVLREFLYQKGLLTSSPDYERKVGALRQVDADLATYVRRHNGTRVITRTGRLLETRPLGEAGVEPSRASIPVFDSSDLVGLASWLNEFEQGPHGHGLSFAPTGDGVLDITLPEGAVVSVVVEPGAGLPARHGQVVHGTDAATYHLRTPPGIDRLRGERMTIEGLYAVVARHVDGANGIAAVLARYEHQLGNAVGWRARRTLRKDLTEHLTALQLDGDALQQLGDLVPQSVRQLTRRGRGRSAQEVAEELEDRIEQGEPEPSRVPSRGVYLGGMALDKLLIGVGNAALGLLVFHNSSWLGATFAIGYGLAEGCGQGYLMYRGQVAGEKLEQGGRRTDEALRAGRDAAQAAALRDDVRDVIRPLLANILTVPAAEPARPSTGAHRWSVPDSEPWVLQRSLRYHLWSNLPYGVMSTVEPVALVGAGAGQWALATVFGISAGLGYIGASFGERRRTRHDVSNRLRQGQFDEVRRIDAGRHEAAERAQRLQLGVAAVVIDAGYSVPSATTDLTGRRVSDARLGRPVFDRRPNRGLDLGQVLDVRYPTILAPGAVGTGIGLFVSPVVAAVQAGNSIVNTWVNALVESGYGDLDTHYTDLTSSQLAHESLVRSRQGDDRMLAGVNDLVRSEIAGPAGRRSSVPGEVVADLVVPEPKAPIMPPVLRKIVPLTALLPGIGEFAAVSTMGSAVAGYTHADAKARQEVTTGSVNAVLTSITGTAGHYPLNWFRAGKQATQGHRRMVEGTIAAGKVKQRALRSVLGDRFGNAAALGRMSTTEGLTADNAVAVARSVASLLGDDEGRTWLRQVTKLDELVPLADNRYRVARAGQSRVVVFAVGDVEDHALAGFDLTKDVDSALVTVSRLLPSADAVLEAVAHDLREIGELLVGTPAGGPDVYVRGRADADAVPTAHDRARETQLVVLGRVADEVADPRAGVRADLALLDAVTHLGLLPGTDGADHRLAHVSPEAAAQITRVAARLTDPHTPASANPLRIVHVSWESALQRVGAQVGGLGSVVKALLPPQVGLGHQVLNVTRQLFGFGAAGLTELISRGGGLQVLLIPPPEGFATEDHLKADEVGWSDAMSDRTRAAVQEYLAAYPDQVPDVMHAHDAWMTRPAFDLADALGIPVVLTVHATEIGRRGGRLDTETRRRIHALEWRTVRRADHVIVNSPKMKEEAVRAFHLSPDRVTILPNGTDPSRWKIDPATVDRAAARSRLKVGPDDTVIYYQGRLAVEKGVQDLIAALPAVQQHRPGAKVRIVGDDTGDFAAELKQQVATLVSEGQLADGDVEFLGRIGHDEGLPALVASADVGVIPSRYEPFGVVANELATAGLPLVASEQIGFVDESNGVNYPAGDVTELVAAIIAVLDDAAGARQRAEAAQVKALSPMYRWDVIARQTVDVYRGIPAHQIRTPEEIGRPVYPQTVAGGNDDAAVRTDAAGRLFDALRADRAVRDAAADDARDALVLAMIDALAHRAGLLDSDTVQPIAAAVVQAALSVGVDELSADDLWELIRGPAAVAGGAIRVRARLAVAEALAQVAAEETEENPWGRALAAIVSAYVMHSGDTRPRVAIGRSEVR
ncbi:glycosyltransferase, partial [Kribbella sp.]|uniref:glycosyltransferase n=1 Tax=Kribbella sp. TaxID=1871183 RepID=UPI002D220317